SGTRRLPPSRTKSFCMSTTTSAVRAGSTRTSSWGRYSGTSIVRLIRESSPRSVISNGLRRPCGHFPRVRQHNCHVAGMPTLVARSWLPDTDECGRPAGRSGWLYTACLQCATLRAHTCDEGTPPLKVQVGEVLSPLIFAADHAEPSFDGPRAGMLVLAAVPRVIHRALAPRWAGRMPKPLRMPGRLTPGPTFTRLRCAPPGTAARPAGL